MTAKPLTRAPRVISYIRFSTPEQALGDSERRQLEAAQEFAARRGLPFDETLRLADRGLSGYHGTHRSRGALGQFLEHVKAGAVPAGSILVVENIDRLGRENVVDALGNVILPIVKRGVTIQTLFPDAAYDREALDTGRIWELVAHITRAHGESERKSHLVRQARDAARKAAREEKRILTRRCPAWLRVTPEGKFEAIPEAAAVRLVFELRLSGLGLPSIERQMNAEALWSPPLKKGQKTEGWRASYLKKILNSPAVVGVYQPHRIEFEDKPDGGRRRVRLPVGDPIPDYFPAVVGPEKFRAVRATFAANRGKGGQTGKARNLLTHLARCAYCGGPMALVPRGPSPRGRYLYLVCDNGRRGVRDSATGKRKCAWHTARYDEAERVLLENCPGLRPADVLPDPDEQAERVRSLRARMQAFESDQREIERQIDNFVNQIGKTDDGDLRARYALKVQGLEERQTALATQRADASRELARAEQSQRSFAKWQVDLKALLATLADGDVGLRQRVRSHLREFIDRVEVFTDGHRKRYDPLARLRALEDARRRLGTRDVQALDADPGVVAAGDGDAFEEVMREVVDEACPERMNDPAFRKELGAFVEHVLGRRLSKEGRFLRVHFKTGVELDLVPEGSLASGFRLAHGGKRQGTVLSVLLVGPEVGRLWAEFQAGHGIPERKRRSKG